MFGWQRNHYDRLIHLGFGLCLACPLREVLAGAVRARPGVVDALALLGMLGFSALYEQLEFWAARLIDPELGLAFVGAQGDPWDAQQDTSLALAGAAVALGLRAWLARR